MYQIQKLTKQHDRKGFDCGRKEINDFLQKQARQSSNRQHSRTYVMVLDDNPSLIVGFYTLCICKIEKPLKHIINKTYSHDMFATKLARMGVDIQYQHNGIAKQLMFDAILNTCKVSSTTGIQGIIVDAKDDSLADYYSKNGFIRLEPKGKTLWLPIQDCIYAVEK